MIITDISNGENFMVGKSLTKKKGKDRIDMLKDIENVPVNCAKLCISSRNN